MLSAKQAGEEKEGRREGRDWTRLVGTFPPAPAPAVSAGGGGRVSQQSQAVLRGPRALGYRAKQTWQRLL